MKDSIGSTLLMKIFVVFMIVYIILMASILNYTKTFRIKNQIINIINRHNGYTASAKQEISDYFSKSSLYGSCTLLEGNNDFGSNNDTRCEIKEYNISNASGGSYYKIKLYVTFQFPLTKRTLQIPITGETKALHAGINVGKPNEDFDLVDSSPTIGAETLKEDSDDECIPGDDPPGATGCCSPTICSSGVKRMAAGGCKCFANGAIVGTPHCNYGQPGRVLSNNNCECCPSPSGNCGATVSVSSVLGAGGSTSARRTNVEIVVAISDPGKIGIKNESCNGWSYSGGTASRKFDSCVDTVVLSCPSFNNSISETINVYSKPAGCKTCSGADCSECNPNYFLFDGDCVSCEGCVTCSASGCSRCIDGYYSENKGCTKCPDGCATCASAAKCTSCSEGYQKVGNVCQACGTNCATCTATNLCLTCKEGFGKIAASQNYCRVCSDANCSECAIYNTCTKCKVGYKKDDASGKCVVDNTACYCCGNNNGCNYKWTDSPGSNCGKVSGRTESNCTGSTACTNISNCARCSSNAKGNCQECNRGYKVVKGNCVKNTCDTGCTLCDDGGNECYSCSDEYYLNSDKDCSQCPSGCKKCSSSSSCSECKSTHTKVGTTCCTTISKCATYNNNCTCNQCESGYHKSGSSCVADATCPSIEGCIRYNNSTCKCTKCDSDYDKTNDGKCKEKTTSPSCYVSHCKSYNSDCTCKSCDSGYHGSSCEADKACGGTGSCSKPQDCPKCNVTTGKWSCNRNNCTA